MQCVRENPDQAERSYCALALEDAGKFLFCCLQRKLFDSVYMWGQSPKLQWAQVGCQDPFWKTEHILFLEHGVKFCFIHNVIFKAIEIFMGLPPPQSEAGVAACIPLPLDISAVYLCFTNPKDKIPTCQLHLFLKEKKKTFFSLFVDLGQMSFLPWQKWNEWQLQSVSLLSNGAVLQLPRRLPCTACGCPRTPAAHLNRYVKSASKRRWFDLW